MKIKFEPWEEYKEELKVLPIAEPPCKHCAYWRPRQEYVRGSYEGVVLCNKSEMHQDFSCYEAREQ